MKKWAAGLVAAALVLPRVGMPGVDIGTLEPVEVIRLTTTAAGIRVETDTGRWAEGRNLQEATMLLQEQAERRIFLDTADKILLTGDMEPHWAEIWGLFRPASQVCLAQGTMDLAEAGAYLETHRTALTLGQAQDGAEVEQILQMEEGRGWLAPQGAK